MTPTLLRITSSHIPPSIASGNYLYREAPGRWWRACTVDGETMTAPWRSGSGRISDGEYYGPLPQSNQEWADANRDGMGRLLRQFEPA